MNPNLFLALPRKELLSADSMVSWYYGRTIRRVPALRELKPVVYMCVLGESGRAGKSADRYNTVLSVVVIRIRPGT